MPTCKDVMTTDQPDPRTDLELALNQVVLGEHDYVLRHLLPHVSFSAAITALEDREAIALPPLFVDGAYWALRGTRGSYVTAMRTVQSYGTPHAGHLRGHTTQPKVLFVDGAIAFATKHWPEKLAKRHGNDAVVFELFWPEALQPHSQVYAELNMLYRDISGDEQLNIMVHNVTYDHLAGGEMVGWSPHRLPYCGICGSAIQQLRCYTCKLSFRRIQQRAVPVDQAMSMPSRVRETFEAMGYSFK